MEDLIKIAPLAISCIQTILAVCAFKFARQEFKQWRIELLGSKKIELAIELGKAAIRVREAFNNERYVGRYYPLKDETDKIIDHNERYKKEQEHDFNYRLGLISAELEKLYEVRLEVEVIFSVSVEDKVKPYNIKYHEFENAIQRIYNQQAHDGDIELVYRKIGDEFEQTINETTEKLLSFAKRHLK